jgi:tetratricopeptide (TPR) repeat protein
MKRFGEALSDFEQALAIRPAFARAMSGKGNAQLSLHQPAAALEFFEHALRSTPCDTAI